MLFHRQKSRSTAAGCFTVKYHVKRRGVILACGAITAARAEVIRAAPGLSPAPKLTENDRVGAPLPEISHRDFSRQLQGELPRRLPPSTIDRLFAHYQELRRWNRRVSLVGPSEGPRLVRRHYVESLAALPLLASRDRVLIDIGTGAGFPGLVLACAKPTLRVTLIEPNQKKWSFLKTACRNAALSCDCLNARVAGALLAELPEQIDVITSRAVRIDELGLELLVGRLAARGRVLLWRAGSLGAEAPAGLVAARQIELAEGRTRRIVEFLPRADRTSFR